MQINEQRIRAKLSPINRVLESRFGLTIDSTDVDHLKLVCEHYTAKRDALLHRIGEAPALKHPDYAKAVLVSEAAAMILREIAPKRIRRKSKSRS